MLSSPQLLIFFMKGRKVASMQFTTQTQQLTTCPQCDNIVRIDAEFCNICGQQLRPAITRNRPGGLQPASSVSAYSSQLEDDEEYEDDEDEDEEDEGSARSSQPIPSAPSE